MHVRARRAAGAADGGDRLTQRDAVADLDEVLIVVRVDGHEAVGMLDLDHPAVAGLVRAGDDRARGGRGHGRAEVGHDVDATVPAQSPTSKRRAHLPVHRPHEGRKQVGEVRHGQDQRGRGHVQMPADQHGQRPAPSCDDADGDHQSLADSQARARAGQAIADDQRGDRDAMTRSDRAERVTGFHEMNGRRRRRGAARRSGERERRSPERSGEDDERHEPLAPHGSNSAKRTSKETKPREGGSQRVVTRSTRASGGPFSSWRTNCSIVSRAPSTRTRTRPSLRFMT